MPNLSLEDSLAAALEGAVRRVTEKQFRGKAETGTGGYYGASPALQMYGANQTMYNAMKLTLQGISTRIPWRGSNFASDKYPILLGVSAVTGAQPSDECAPGPVAGTVSVGKFSNPFGRWKMQTPSFDVTRFNEIRDRSTFADYTLGGDPFAETPITVPTPANSADLLRKEIAKIMFEFKVGWLRTYNPVLHYTGNPTNNVGNGYLEPKGLDLLINTGYVDVDTSAAMTGVDSLVRSFGNVDITNTGSVTVNSVTYTTGGGTAAVAEIVAMYRTLKMRAQKTGLAPVNLAIVMTRSLFYELTQVWPCNYLTARCNVAAGALSLDAGQQIALRDEMRGGEYLKIDGEQVAVILDNDIAETVNAGVYTTGIYFIPLTILGGTPSLWGEYFDMAAPGGAIEASNLLGNMGDMTVTGNGRFLWTRERTGTCLTWTAIERPRLVLPTPHLAGRLTNMKFTPLIYEQ